MKITKSTKIDLIVAALGVDHKRAGWIRKLATVGTRGWSKEGFEQRFPKTAHWAFRECYNEPSGVDLVMAAINETMGDQSFGVEAIFSKFSCVEPEILYVNLGDTYALTVTWRDWACHIESWGDAVESMEAEGCKFE